MEIQIFTLQQQGPDEIMPRCLLTYVSPKGPIVAVIPEYSAEVLRALRDHLNTDIAKIESEAAMLRAMGNQPQPGASH